MGLFTPINFERYDDDELLDLYNEMNSEDETELTLEIVESIASDHCMISSDTEASAQFDDMLEEFNFQHYDDKPMMREEFNNWLDGIEQDGQIHRLQCFEYCYCGKHDID